MQAVRAIRRKDRGTSVWKLLKNAEGLIGQAHDEAYK